MRSHAQMLGYRIGERVRFTPPGRGEVVGTLTRYNKKTVTVICDDGEHWNVPPSLLSRPDAQGSRDSRSANPAVTSFFERTAS